MHLLIADDDVVSARVVGALITSWGHTCTTVHDGNAALKILRGPTPPDIALLDWVMPGMQGVDVCRQVRQQEPAVNTYIILLTGKDAVADVVGGLDAGADDYLVKPFDPEELRARVRAAARIVGLQKDLTLRVQDLEAALGNVRKLGGLLPICSYCKSIRDDSDYWHRVESYVAEHSEAKFSHGICPTCLETVVEPQLKAMSLGK